ncbi:glycosyltransferase family 39 protein [Candidatus Woesearchaeota archaeon]|nr:MAG: hypothetical protein QT09_C0002G0020 [archaeon GW2011_AR18]MBS3161903.1 glycosyltransferase family 39 protein [Candidatus Woesearchaeota archaeon]HIH26107.1 hypothetical protein [Nanoarchaeota archaeon]
MKLKIEYLLLIIILLSTITFRLYFSLNTESFKSDDSYFHLRQVQNILQEHHLLKYDPLSYGGRIIVYPPLYHLLLALLSFGNVILIKIISEILISTLVVIVYLITKELTGDGKSALFSALLSAFIPGLISHTLNELTVYTLALPLLFLALYLFLKLENRRLLIMFLVSLALLSLTHPLVFIFILVMLFYFFLIGGGALNASKIEKEAAILSILFVMLVSFIIYKKAFFTYGINIIWQNAPLNILVDKFKDLTPIDLVLNVGIFSLLLGSIGLYLGMTNEKKKSVYLFSSFMLGVLFLLSFRLITLSFGLVILSIGFAIFTSITLRAIYKFLDVSKIGIAKNIFTIILLVLFIFFSFIPSYTIAKNSQSISTEKLNDMLWIKYNTEKDAVILGNLQEGNLIKTLGERKNVIDSNFLLAPSPVERINDVRVIYTGLSEAKALSLTRKYDITTIYLSEDTKKAYNIKELNYAIGSRCFVKEGNFYVIKC